MSRNDLPPPNPTSEFFEFGRDLVRETRLPADGRLPLDPEGAISQFRWGADGYDDDDVWQVLLGALTEAESYDDLWYLSDGFIPESVVTRPTLDQRLLVLERTDPKMIEIMQIIAVDPTLDWRSISDAPE